MKPSLRTVTGSVLSVRPGTDRASTLDAVSFIRGIDTSHHQGAINWHQVKGDGIEFAFIKATEGDGRLDPGRGLYPHVDRYFEENRELARAAGIPAGFYHFARRSKDDGGHLADAEREARHFCRTVGALSPDELAPVLDIEWDKRTRGHGWRAQESVEWCLRFLEVTERLLKRRPIVYTGPSFWRFKLGRSLAMNRFDLWHAKPVKERFGRHVVKNPIPGWPARIWQYSHSGRVAGIRGPVDLNRFMGTREEFEAWKQPTAANTPPYVDAFEELVDGTFARAVALAVDFFQPSKPRRAA